MKRSALAPVVALVLSSATAIGAESGAAIFRGTEVSDRAARIAGVPQTGLRCSGCHGRDASGARTGSADIPPVDGPTLSKATARRPPYDQALFARALREGLRSDGQPLALAMPRFALDDGEIDALWRFLGEIADEERRGVGPTSVRLAVAARPEGRAAADALRRSLEAAWSALGAPRVNGRRVSFETMIADPAGGAVPDVFAVVGAEPGTPSGTGLSAELARNGLPVIGPAHAPPPGATEEPGIVRLGDGEAAVEAFMAQASAEPGRFGRKATRFVRTARQLSRLFEGDRRALPATTFVVSIFAAKDPQDLVRLAESGADTILVRPADPYGDPKALSAALATLVQAGLAAAGRDLTRTRFLEAVSRLRPAPPAATTPGDGVDLLHLTLENRRPTRAAEP